MRLKPTAKKIIGGRASLISWITNATTRDRGIARFLSVGATSALQVHVDGPGAHRSRQRRMVPLGLIGIGEGELAHRLVEFILPAQIAADRPWIARFRVRSRQHPAA